MFQSDGHNPIDLSAFHTEAPPAPPTARPKFRFRRPQAPLLPEPPSFPKPAKAPKAAKEPRKGKEPKPEPPIDTVPPGTWPPAQIPQQGSLPASIAYVVWKAVVYAVIAVFYVVRFIFQLALSPFMHMLG